MIIPIYRLPLGVTCFSKNRRVQVLGNEGLVFFRSSCNLYRKGHITFFLPFLDSYYSSIFSQAALGVVLGYSIELRLKGIGYRVRKEDSQLIFSLGYSQPVILTVPYDISIRFEKKSFFLTSANLSLLRNFATSIRSLRFPDSYKGNGVLYGNEKIICKEGKKT